LPKIVSKSGIAAKNNRMRHATEFEDIINKNLSHRGCCEWVLKGIEMRIFGNKVHYHHDDLLIAGFR
jgi:hypothetical protein